MSEKYNKNGQLNSQVIEALAGDTSVESFKDIVLEVLAKAPQTAKLEKNVNNNNKDSNVEDIRAKLAECKDPVERGSPM